MKRTFACFLVAFLLLTLAACNLQYVSQVDPYSVTLPPDYVLDIAGAETLPSEITFDKMVVCEGDDYDIAINGIMPDAADGYTLMLSLSNNTEARYVTKTEFIYQTDDDGEKQIVGEQEIVESVGLTYRFTVDSAIVNGKEVDVSFSADVDAEDRTIDQIVLKKEAVEDLGTITQIQLFFKVYVSREEDYLISEFSTMVYPYGDLSAEG